MKTLITLLALCLNAYSFASYKLPSDEITGVLKAGAPPSFYTNIQKSYGVEVSYNLLPSIEFLSRQILKLGGIKFNPRNFSKYRSYYNTGYYSFDLKTKKRRRIKGPKGVPYSSPKFSPNGEKIAFSIENKNCVELWTANLKNGKAKKFKNLCLNTIMGSGITWVTNDQLIVRGRKIGQRKLKEMDDVPSGPVVMEAKGKVAQNRTYQNLLSGQNDIKMFTHYAGVQFYSLSLKRGKKKKFGPPGIFSSYSTSPNKKYLVLSRVKAPFSFVVPYYFFARNIEVWSLKGKKVKTVAKLPVFDSLPIQGVPTGIRRAFWDSSRGSRLYVVEALDKGDWAVKVPHRDKLSSIDFNKKSKSVKKEVLRTVHRYSGIEVFEDHKRLVVWDYEREKKFVTGTLYDTEKKKAIKQLWGYGVNDEYNKPGDIVSIPNKFKRQTIQPQLINGEEWVYLSGKGATPKGSRPFLKRFNLASGKTEMIFHSGEKSLERFSYFLDKNYKTFITRYQSATESPRYLKYRVDSKANGKLYWMGEDPAKIFSTVKREIMRYKRDDGVELSGILYYPVGYKKGNKYPVVVSAYPRQYSTAREAGQVRGSSNKYSRPYRASNLYYLLKGYAVLQKAQMPIVGSPENMNDTFLKQLVMNAEATVGALKSHGILDGDRVAVTGHSYGAFMVANLLTHTNLFKAGIARSGAYNRTLTPFGFQNERRTFWKASDTYLKVSPFMTADKMKRPLLMIHGEEDPNSGTFPMQSKRYFAALKANGANARLVLLPKEGHGYAAYESIAHVLWEQFDWLEKHL